MESHKLTIHEIKDLIDNGKLSIEELVKGVIQRIGKTEAQIKAFNTLETEKIVEEARAIDDFISEGKPLSNLAGIPLGVQDNISTLGIRTSCSSRIIETFIPPYDASVIGRLKEHHAIILGKLNMDEFGIGASTETSAFGPTRNPWNLHRVAGGAAGGAAAAVAADQAFYALASDSAGCLRQPAAFCGVVGLKPTYGLVSRYGLIASAPSLEQIGCITKDVTDCAYVLEEIAFHDKKDPTSPKACRSKYTKGIIDDIRGLKIGIPKEILMKSWDPDVRDSINVALDMFKQLGADLVDITLPHSNMQQQPILS